jgi:hypothetical protein
MQIYQRINRCNCIHLSIAIIAALIVAIASITANQLPHRSPQDASTDPPMQLHRRIPFAFESTDPN